MDRNELQKLITGELNELDKVLLEIFPLDDRVEKKWDKVKDSFAKWDKKLQKVNKSPFIPSDIEPAIDALNQIKTAVWENLTEDASQKLAKILKFVTTEYESIMAEQDKSNGGSGARVSSTGSE